MFVLQVANHSTNAEYIRLLHDIHADNIESHPWRGYIIMETSKKNSIKEIQNNKNVKRPIWFIFSALGAQWPTMGIFNILRSTYDSTYVQHMIEHKIIIRL